MTFFLLHTLFFVREPKMVKKLKKKIAHWLHLIGMSTMHTCFNSLAMEPANNRSLSLHSSLDF